MPCVLDSPFCSYDSYSIDEDETQRSRRDSHSQASTSGMHHLSTRYHPTLFLPSAMSLLWKIIQVCGWGSSCQRFLPIWRAIQSLAEAFKRHWGVGHERKLSYMTLLQKSIASPKNQLACREGSEPIRWHWSHIVFEGECWFAPLRISLKCMRRDRCWGPQESRGLRPSLFPCISESGGLVLLWWGRRLRQQKEQKQQQQHHSAIEDEPQGILRESWRSHCTKTATAWSPSLQKTDGSGGSVCKNESHVCVHWCRPWR